ncbi:hypothetical protein H8B13_14315 [Hymenobacter sp. BT188]|uniref:hypothetical protein n=1 Tax=Hymenobacter sp. BT188 TaxID=2763504 RepID=UPI00165160B6|nr:hypothetical protein [Hymenobacter sp. BT188]MBC6607997.1 hypothetical protein [Hymenobacter sp. BT188]
MRKSLLVLALCSGSLLFGQCRGLFSKALDPQPAVPVLPEATQTGRNTVGFLVNDTVWLPQGNWNRPRLGGYYGEGRLVLYGNYSPNANPNDQAGFGLYLGNARSGPGTYPLYAPLNTGRSSGGTFSRGAEHYETNATHNGVLTITRLDSVKRIVSGEFSFSPVDRAGNTVRITSGRFDMQY